MKDAHENWIRNDELGKRRTRCLLGGRSGWSTNTIAIVSSGGGGDRLFLLCGTTGPVAAANPDKLTRPAVIGRIL